MLMPSHCIYIKIVSEYDQEIPQSQIADNPVAPRRRAAQPDIRIREKVYCDWTSTRHSVQLRRTHYTFQRVIYEGRAGILRICCSHATNSEFLLDYRIEPGFISKREHRRIFIIAVFGWTIGFLTCPGQHDKRIPFVLIKRLRFTKVYGLTNIDLE